MNVVYGFIAKDQRHMNVGNGLKHMTRQKNECRLWPRTKIPDRRMNVDHGLKQKTGQTYECCLWLRTKDQSDV